MTSGGRRSNHARAPAKTSGSILDVDLGQANRAAPFLGEDPRQARDGHARPFEMLAARPDERAGAGVPGGHRELELAILRAQRDRVEDHVLRAGAVQIGFQHPDEPRVGLEGVHVPGGADEPREQQRHHAQVRADVEHRVARAHHAAANP